MSYEMNGATLQMEMPAGTGIGANQVIAIETVASVPNEAVQGNKETIEMPAVEQMLDFLHMLAADERIAIEVFTDAPSSKKPTLDPLAKTWGDLTAAEIEKMFEDLQRRNAEGAAVYCAVNEFDGKRKKANLKCIRGVHMDGDGLTDEQIEAVKSRLKPTMVVQSSEPDHVQMYWLLAEGETLDMETAEGINRRLVEWGGDTNATDITRLLRLPGFMHRKYADEGRVYPVTMIECSGVLYTAQELMEAFPPKAKERKASMPTGKPKALDIAGERPTGASGGVGEFGKALVGTFHEPLPETPENIEKVRGMLAALDPDMERSEWMRIVWSVLHLGWDCGVELVREWSQRGKRFTEDGFQNVVGSFDPTRGITFGTLVHYAKEAGWVGDVGGGAVVGASGMTVTNGTWAEPQPMPPKYPVPPKLDTSILPYVLAAYVNDSAMRMQVPPEMIATPLIISLGSVIGKLLAVQPKQSDASWWEYPTFWGVAILPPAMLKSPALNAGTLPIQKLEDFALKQHSLAMLQWNSDERVRKLEIEQKQSEARSAVKKGDTLTAKKLLDAVHAVQPPIRKRYVIQDATPEARLDILTENPNGCMVIRDELDGHMAQLRRDGYESARAQELQFYDGKQDYANDRIKRGSSVAEAPRLSLYGNLQPAKVEKYLRDLKHGGNDDGYVQRLFQLGIQPTLDKEFKLLDLKGDSAAQKAVQTIFDAVAAMPPTISAFGKRMPRMLKFTPDAQSEFNAFLGQLESKLRSGSMNPAQAAHIGKYRGTLPKLALVMAFAEDQNATEINLLALQRAQRLLEFYSQHAKRIYAVDTRSDVLSAYELLERIRKGQVTDGFNPRDDVLRREWDGLSRSAELEAAISLLVKLGYLRETEVATAGRPRRVVHIHPSLLKV